MLEACYRKAVPCPKAGGFVQILGGGTIADGIENPVSIAVSPPTGELYVGNNLTKAFGSVTIYVPGRMKPQNTIPHIKGNPHGISIYSTGDAYVASQYAFQCCQLRSRVAAYVPGTSRPTHVLRDVAPFASAPVFDASEHLYVANFDVFPGWVAVYPPGRSKPSRVLRDGIGFPERLATMPDGTLYVLNRKFDHSSDILVFPPGGTTASRTIAAGLDGPLAIALDAAGNLYVANGGRRGRAGNVSIYPAGSSAVARTISKGIDRPVDLAIGASDRLFVLNAPGQAVNTVTVYDRGASSPFKTFALEQSGERLAVAL